MERERILEYQKRFSCLNLVIILLVFMLVIEHDVYTLDYNVSGFVVGSVVMAIVESLIHTSSFFHKLSITISYRYIELMGVACLISLNHYSYLKVILGVAYLLIAFEFIINFSVKETYHPIITLVCASIPAILVQFYKAFDQDHRHDVITNLISILIIIGIMVAFLCYFLDVTNRLERKYLAQLRYIDDANAVNQQLVENQEKVKKANEQLAYQKVQLESANRRINNVNMEISLQNQILKLISANHVVENLMDLIAVTVRTQMSVDTFAIILLPNAFALKDLNYYIKTTYGVKYQQNLSKKILAGAFNQYMDSKKTFVDNHVTKGNYDFIQNAEVGSILVIPLIKGEETLGCLYIADSKYDAFIDNVTFFESAVSSINLAIENSNLYSKLEEMAIKDELTGIFNRRYLNQACEQYIYESLRDKTPFSVALFDIDKFKNINDSYGHLFGDEALKLISAMAEEIACKVGGIAGRYGGEEFMVLFPKRNLQSTYEVVKEYHDKIRNTPFYHNKEEVHIRLSVGISSFPETCLDPNDLMNYSDLALYYSKQNGRDRITIDSSTIREQVRLK